MYKILVNFSLSLERKPGTGKKQIVQNQYFREKGNALEGLHWDKRFHLNSPGITRFSVQMVSSPVVRVSDSDYRQ